MTVDPSPQISLIPDLSQPIPSSQIAVAGKPVGTRVPGINVEGVWPLSDAVLLATSDDIPYEDSLHFVLMTPRYKIIEIASIYLAYQTGQFHPLTWTPPKLRFRFFEGRDMALEILDHPQVRLPVLGSPKGVHQGWSPLRRLRFTDVGQ